MIAEDTLSELEEGDEGAEGHEDLDEAINTQTIRNIMGASGDT